jgi:hypothetical protein
MVFAPIFRFRMGGILGEQALFAQAENKKPERGQMS